MLDESVETSPRRHSTAERRVVDERLEALVASATLEEKLAMLQGSPLPRGVRADGVVAAIPRLGVPEIREIGSGAGLTGGPATALPAPIAHAATWDIELSYACGAVIGIETRAQGANVAIGGDVNIARVPLNGRNFEAYGEDPFLAARMIVPHLRAIQAQGVVATVKHYALNNQEENRGSLLDYPPGVIGVDSRVDERTLRQIYLPAFEAAVKEAEVGVVMTAYNRVNGQYCSENRMLLNDILKDEWGFTGWVVSDWRSVHSTHDAARNGLDQEMPLGMYFGEALADAVRSGEIPESIVDDKVRRIWGTLLRVGAFDALGASERPGSIGHRDHLIVARDVAVAGAVLLKNDGRLPLDSRKLARVAVVGPDADASAAVVAGGGSSHVIPCWSDTLLDALRAHLPGVDVTFAPGVDPPNRSGNMPGGAPVPSAVLRTGIGPSAERGVVATYYPLANFEGSPLEIRVDPYAGAFWRPGRSPFNGDTTSLKPPPDDARSAVWEGVFVCPATGEYTFELTSEEGSRLFWDGELLIDNGGIHAAVAKAHLLQMTEGEVHAVRVEYSPEQELRVIRCKLGWVPPAGVIDDSVREAVDVARRADVVIVVARDMQTEGRDQATLHLPNDQDRLIGAVAAANPNTVVVLRTGGPVLMPWIDDVGAVLEAWYGGAMGGEAIARLLIGTDMPSGKLPITFPRSRDDLPTTRPEQYPGVDHVAVYSEQLEVGYRYYDSKGIEPLFPFGHGLSYTEFAYDDLGIERQSVDKLSVSFTVTNVGSRRGIETPQVYVALPAAAGEPPQRLVGFRRVTLLPGESRNVTIDVLERELSIWEVEMKRWVVPSGRFEIHVGGSSRDQPLAGGFDV